MRSMARVNDNDRVPTGYHPDDHSNHSNDSDHSHIALATPSLRYKASFLEMIREWEQAGEKPEPFVLRMDMSDFDNYLQTLQNLKTAPVGNRKTVNVSTYWIISGERDVIGCVTIRHDLNEHLRMMGGHISFGIRPSERGKGLATRALALALQEARKVGLHRVLLTCDEDHAAAIRVIEHNGGKRENEVFFNGKMIQRYWIDIE